MTNTYLYVRRVFNNTREQCKFGGQIVPLDPPLYCTWMDTFFFKKKLKSNLLFLGQLKKTYIKSHLKNVNRVYLVLRKECQNHPCRNSAFFNLDFFEIIFLCR
uniref:Uncharacterized protein n=1 Tax=Micrurus corallinus TaxID=54390 RepID=A0A2D4EYJ2_MICCO